MNRASENKVKFQIKSTREIGFVEAILGLIKTYIEEFLEIEFEQFRKGYKEKSVRQRNGYYRRSLVTEFGLIKEIKVPRYRAVVFINSLFGKWQRRRDKVDEIVTKMFLQGESCRDIRRIFREIYRDSLAISSISRITNKMLEKVIEFHQRRITEEYTILWIDGIFFPVKDKGTKKAKGKNRVILTVLGLNKQSGKKEIIDYIIAPSENKYSYVRLFKSLLKRGLNTAAVEVIVHDGEHSICSAVEEVFSNKVRQQDCIFHKLQNLGKLVNQKSLKEQILKDAGIVYCSRSLADYNKRKKSFILRYYRIEPEVVESFKQDDLIKTKFAFPSILHRYINTTNHIDRAFREVRRRTNTIGCFEHSRSLDKNFFLVINFLNQLFGNRSFEPILSITQF
jgi:putative transposase